MEEHRSPGESLRLEALDIALRAQMMSHGPVTGVELIDMAAKIEEYVKHGKPS